VSYPDFDGTISSPNTARFCPGPDFDFEELSPNTGSGFYPDFDYKSLYLEWVAFWKTFADPHEPDFYEDLKWKAFLREIVTPKVLWKSWVEGGRDYWTLDEENLTFSTPTQTWTRTA
jgi:hypothetical protein